MAIAEELKLNGLTGAQGDAKPDSEPYETKVKQNKIHTKKNFKTLQDELSLSIQNDSKDEQASNERALSIFLI